MVDHRENQVLSTLVRERGRHLTTYAFLLTGDTAAAQDLVQDAGPRAWASPGWPRWLRSPSPCPPP